MKPRKSKKGLSAILVIVMILVVAAVAVGGYFAYTNYFAPMMSPYSKLIPDGLKAYARGADADGFIVIRKDAEITKAISALPLPAAVNDFKSAIILLKSSSQSVAAIAEFGTKDAATSVLDMINAQKNNLMNLKLEQKDNILIASYGSGLDGFTGQLLDNPNIKNLDPAMMDSQVIIGLDLVKMAEASTIPFSIINSALGGAGPWSGSAGNNLLGLVTAHAQGLINPGDTPFKVNGAIGVSASPQNPALESANVLMALAKNCFIYVQLKNDNLTAKLAVNILARNEIANSPSSKIMNALGTSTDISELEKIYDRSVKTLSDNVSTLQKELDNLKTSIAGITGIVEFKDNTLNLTFNAPLPGIEKYALQQTMTAPEKTRDANRKADLETIETMVEAYNLQKNSYPKDSGCVEAWSTVLPDIVKLVAGGKIPADPSGTQSFGTDTCPGGYYYQSFGSDGYALWARMEIPENGNTALTPDDFAKEISAGTAFKAEKSGLYFVLNEVNPTTGGNNAGTKPSISQGTAVAPASSGQSQESQAPLPSGKKVKRSP